jgi:hypothetical protein
MKTDAPNVDSYAGPSMRPAYFTGRSYHGPLHGHSKQGPSLGLSLSNRGRSEAIIQYLCMNLIIIIYFLKAVQHTYMSYTLS